MPLKDLRDFIWSVSNVVIWLQVVVIFLHEQFTWLKGLGLVIIVFGVALFNWFKYTASLHFGVINQNDQGLIPFVTLWLSFVTSDLIDTLHVSF